MKALCTDTDDIHLVLSKDEAHMIRDLEIIIDFDFLVNECKMDPAYALRMDEMLRKADGLLSEVGIYYRGYPLVQEESWAKLE